MRRRLAAIAVGATCLWAGIAEAGSVSQKTTFFAVHGGTLAELDRDLNRRGPYVAGTGMRHPGATEVRFTGKMTYKQVAGGCAVDRADLSLELNVTLPRWMPPKRVAAQTVLVWRTLEEDIKRHENEHAKIARNWRTRMEMAIRNLRPEPTCEAMGALVNTVAGRYLAGHERAQIEFDTIEGREVNFRLRRALYRTMQGYDAR